MHSTPVGPSPRIDPLSGVGVYPSNVGAGSFSVEQMADGNQVVHVPVLALCEALGISPSEFTLEMLQQLTSSHAAPIPSFPYAPSAAVPPLPHPYPAATTA
eukprot:RCo008923